MRPDGRELISVSQLNRYVAAAMNRSSYLRNLAVRGELSNVSCPRSGHIYFNLKDAKAQVPCVMFRSQAASLQFRPEDGQAVSVYGRAALFERDGRFQIYVDRMEAEGRGDLFQAYEKLKAKFKAEGLFDPSHKRPMPPFPKRIGVATSATGAVIRDIINVSKRRWPSCEIVLAPCSVQGPGSAESIVRALALLNAKEDIDLIIVGRGGGSIEDLWPFNEEIVVRAVYASDKPIISAVGHETDFTLCDFTADLRAPTPSAAAELALPDAASYRRTLLSAENRLSQLLKQKLIIAEHRLERLASNRYLVNPYERIRDRRMLTERLSELQESTIKEKLNRAEHSLQRLSASLDALSPLKVLSRGYALVSDPEHDRPISSIKDIREGDCLRLNMKDGRLLVRAEKKE